MKKGLTIFSVVILMSTMAMGQLIAYWPFDEGTGYTANDSSGNGNTGTLSTAGGANYPTWITGHNGSGKALQFNASTTGTSNSNNVIVPIDTTDALANLGRVFTISVWVRRDAVDYSTTTVAPRVFDTDAYDIELALNPDGDSSGWDPYDFFWSDTHSSWQLYLGLENDAQKTLGSWYHLAIVSNGQLVKKYINGVAVGSAGSPTEVLPTANLDLYIGTRTDNNGYLRGALDDLAIWSGKYISDTEIAKLVAGTATPLTVAESDGLTQVSYVMETPVFADGWEAVWFPYLSKEFIMSGGQIKLFGTVILESPGDRHTVGPWGWNIKYTSDYSNAPEVAGTRGVEWIDPSWSGREPNVAVVAAFITPGILLGQTDKDYHLYNPSGPNLWEDKPYFKTKLRVASLNANGAKARIAVYQRSSNVEPDSTNYSTLLTLLGDVEYPLNAGDNVWQTLDLVLPKPESATRIPLWFEVSIVGGTSETVLYIDEFKPVSSLYATFTTTNLNEDTFVDYSDLGLLTDNWLDGLTSFSDPRTGGLLVNGDFTADMSALGSEDNARVYMNPTGWTYTGTVANNYGIQRVDNKGEMNFWWNHTLEYPAVATPLGGYVAAYLKDSILNDSYGVLSQTTSATAAAAGQTYYAMGYVMTNTWYGWKDEATMDISINGTTKASFKRVLSRNKWRPIYGTYTATAADAGKPIKISFSYSDIDANSVTVSLGNMLVGYTYLGTTIPSEWPEKRTNLLTNGGFEDLSVIQALSEDMYYALTASDNSGRAFTDDVHPVTPGWIYEVPSGFYYGNEAGIWSTGYYGSPLPTSGMHDISFYTGDVILGQVISTALTAGTTYYLDTACGILTNSYYDDVQAPWPNPAPQFHIQLWRIPAGVTDGTVIYNAIASGNTNYVKVAEANALSTGNIIQPKGYKASKWQIIGTSYTAKSLDTNMYIRVYGTGGLSYSPEYAFSDVYLSTQKRDIPGGAVTFDLSSGLQYNTTGPYTCYHAGIMGLVPDTDIDGDCIVNFGDFALLAEDWLEVGFN
jgi:hypothetical protein